MLCLFCMSSEYCSGRLQPPCVRYETTSLALSYALYEVARRPELQERLRQEAEALLARLQQEGGGGGKSGGGAVEAMGYSHLAQLPLADATFSESLRMYPPATPLMALVGGRQSLGQLTEGCCRLAPCSSWPQQRFQTASPPQPLLCCDPLHCLSAGAGAA